MEWIDARYDGECATCKRKTTAGERIYYSYEEKRAWCKECCAKAGIVEASTKMAVSSEDNGQRVAVTVKWELVATADDIIVLRRR